MKNKKVAILMSTYNGDKFLSEQIDSLLEQTYNNVTVYIRDDGSKDHTVDIINEYKSKNNNIVLIKGENVGFINSFFELLSICNDSDYYAYCDQDDVWMKDKIDRAVNFLEKSDANKPVLYFSNSDYYDENMNFIATAEKNKKYSFRNSLVECVTQGMTMVINNKAREIITKNKPTICLYHDWWTYMVCSGLGEIIYDDKSLVKYRRHAKSVTVEGKRKIQLLIWRIKKFLFGNSLTNIKKQLQEFETYYYNYLSEENKKILKLFTQDRYNIWNALKKTFYKKRFRNKILDEISIRLLFLLGRL